MDECSRWNEVRMKDNNSDKPLNSEKKSEESPNFEEVDVGEDDDSEIILEVIEDENEAEVEPAIPEEWKGKPDSEITLLREIQKLKTELDETKKNWFDKYARLQAEFENSQRRNLKEKQNFIQYASAELISKLLPIIDSFEIMLKSLEQKMEPNEFKGIKMIFTELMKVFEKEGLTPIKAKGEIFDPYVHEILTCDYTDEIPEDQITEEFQKGYKVKDRVIRPSKVKIAKPKPILDKKCDSEIKEDVKEN